MVSALVSLGSAMKFENHIGRAKSQRVWVAQLLVGRWIVSAQFGSDSQFGTPRTVHVCLPNGQIPPAHTTSSFWTHGPAWAFLSRV